MKIILLINSLYTGGAEFSSLSLYGWLKERQNVEISIVCLKKANPEYNHKEFGIKDIIYLKEKSFILKYKELNRLVKEINPDIIHSVLFEANILGRFNRILNRKFIHVESLVTEMYSPFRLKNPEVNIMKFQAYRFFDFITQFFGVDHYHANGISVATHYRDKMFIKRSRITVVPRGRKENLFLNNTLNKERVKKELGLRDKVVLINVARHDFPKAQTVLLDALNFISELKEEYILLLVGRSGELTKEIEQKIRDYNLDGSVKILGHRTDVNELLAASDIFVFPSRFEGLPGALIEAEAAALPIICSDISNNLEVVEENKNAMIFQVDDPEKFSRKLRELIINPGKHQLMGEESLRIYKSKFGIDQSHEKMLNLFSSLIIKN